MRRIDTGERRARLAARHCLAPGAHAADAVEVADALVGLHASDPASVFLATWARTCGLGPGDLEYALYEARSLLRVVAMRRTMFVLSREAAAISTAACTRAYEQQERRRLVAMLETAGIASAGDGWLEKVEAATVTALDRLGEATATELTARVPGLGTQVPFGSGKAYEGTFGVSTRVLFLLATEGRIIRGRPRGSWTSSLYRWTPLDRWIPGGLRPWSPPEARVELARRWLRAFGPGTVADLRWWSGWSVRQVREALAALDVAEVDLDGTTGLVLPNDLEETPDGEPWVTLLPSLDPSVMGWKERAWYLGEHGAALFDRNGNAGATIWCHGRVVGGWAQRRDGEIALRFLEDVGRDAEVAVGETAGRLAAWLGSTRITPRFRTPLEQELTA